jgi:hypothetical protein
LHRARHRQLLQQNSVDKREQGGICSDPEREGKHRGCRKTRIFAALPKREAEVAPNVFDTPKARLVAVSFFRRFNGPEFTACRL